MCLQFAIGHEAGSAYVAHLLPWLVDLLMSVQMHRVLEFLVTLGTGKAFNIRVCGEV